MQITTQKVNKNGTATGLLEKLLQLPDKEQIKIYRRLSAHLKKTPEKNSAVNHEFLKTELGQYISKEADTQVSIEQARKALSKITDSLAQEIIAEREER